MYEFGDKLVYAGTPCVFIRYGHVSGYAYVIYRDENVVDFVETKHLYREGEGVGFKSI